MQIFNNITSSNWLVQNVVNNTASVISPTYDWIKEISRSITHTIVGTIVDDQSTISGRTVVMITTSIVVCAAALKFLNASYKKNKKMKEEIKKFESKVSDSLIDMISFKRELETRTFSNELYIDRVSEFKTEVYYFTNLIKGSDFKISIDTNKLMDLSILVVNVCDWYKCMLDNIYINVDRKVWSYSNSSPYQSPRFAHEKLLEQIDVLLSLKGEKIIPSDESNHKAWNALEETYKDLCSLVNPLPTNSKMKSARK